MISTLNSIANTIMLILRLVVNTLVSVVKLIGMLPGMVNGILGMLDVLPTFSTTFVLAGVSLTVILFFMNMSKGGAS